MILFSLFVLVGLILVVGHFIKNFDEKNYRLVTAIFHVLAALCLYADGRFALLTDGFGIDREPVYPLYILSVGLALYSMASIPLIVYKKSRKTSSRNLVVLLLLAFALFFIAWVA